MNKHSSFESRGNIFFENLPLGFRVTGDFIEQRLLREYGAVFVARGGATIPKKIVFEDSTDVTSFQQGLQKTTELMGGFEMQLQTPAMNALQRAIREAERREFSIRPRGTDSAGRNYDQTVELWASRVEPALKHWVGNGKISLKEADGIKALTPYQQVPEVLRLEEQGIFFAKDLLKSIIYSVAPPGTSQHLAMLAFDIREHDNPSARTILENEGWYQTVISDLPHFTFLGVRKKDLSGLGLKEVNNVGRSFWIPDI